MKFIMLFDITIKLIFFGMLFDGVQNHNGTSLMVVLCIAFYYMMGMCYSFFVSKEKYYRLYQTISPGYIIFDMVVSLFMAVGLWYASYTIMGIVFVLLIVASQAHYWHGYKQYKSQFKFYK